ncbi:uncharacterized protein BO88DRAFT_468911 [Aspergillus vadensis CBS 113365]|uniref:Uncharacterized protein n=1 Tax=Aspergillus vadensis (strain CBS 113365 / IMI 142717 / IBT 24658) TaxID=1448311 RepID=A0A319B1K0_ASPVC|nr:hypothetical protein BO88DRAFT_468911 [Aspergillus vadensis CBS 113365]PYH66537.1 hypothetical protein BO88DRAFT_468911 [Aspergillus vadensis CBS 113365]
MAESKVRKILRSLYLEVVGGEHSTPFVSDSPGSEGDIMPLFLQEHNICVSSWDIESSSEYPSSVQFAPRSRSFLQAHPTTSDLPFPNYIPLADRNEAREKGWLVTDEENCSDEAALFFTQYATANRVFHRPYSSLMDFCEVRKMTPPNPFMSYATQIGPCPSTGRCWGIRLFLEPQIRDTPPFPHIAAVAYQPMKARDGSILCGELATILNIMRSRVKEFKVESEEMIEGLSDMNEQELEDLSQKSPAFPNEQKFPVLLVSFVGPQHARLLCASMYTHALIIHASKLYSFEREQHAPLDLFMSWLFAHPVVVA